MSHIPNDAASYRLATSAPTSFWTLLARPFDFFSAWNARSRDHAQLLDLDDRMLADIGISRREVEKMASQPFWRV